MGNNAGFVGEKYLLYFINGLVYMEERVRVKPIEDFLICMGQVPEHRAFIQKEDVPVFCSQLLPVLEEFCKCEKKDFDEAGYLQTPASFEVYLDAPQKDFVTCRLFAVYGKNGEEKYNLYKEDEEKGQGIRDMFREMEVKQMVADYFNAFDEEEA